MEGLSTISNYLQKSQININCNISTEYRQIALQHLYHINKDIIRKQLDRTSHLELKSYCENITEFPRPKAIKMFYNKYISIINKRLKKDQIQNRLILFEINQDLFERYSSFNKFMDYFLINKLFND